MVDATNGRRWYDPHRVLAAIAALGASAGIAGGGWAIGNINSSTVKNAAQDAQIEAVKERMERLEKGVDRANTTLDEMNRKLFIGGGK